MKHDSSKEEWPIPAHGSSGSSDSKTPTSRSQDTEACDSSESDSTLAELADAAGIILDPPRPERWPK